MANNGLMTSLVLALIMWSFEGLEHRDDILGAEDEVIIIFTPILCVALRNIKY